jgi:hypothetical protein
MINKEISIPIKPSYNEGQLNLIKIWNDKLDTFKRTGIDTGYIMFTRPQKENITSEILGIPCVSKGYVNGNLEFIKMTTENYLYLMSKTGIEVIIT